MDFGFLGARSMDLQGEWVMRCAVSDDDLYVHFVGNGMHAWMEWKSPSMHDRNTGGTHGQVCMGHVGSNERPMECTVKEDHEQGKRALRNVYVWWLSMQPVAVAYVGGALTWLMSSEQQLLRPCLLHPEIQKVFKILRHIESCGICMKH